MRKDIAFTLIEVILVIVIIAMLAGLILPRLTGQSETAKIGATKIQISALKTAVKRFEADCGRFPSTVEGLEALVKRPVGLREAIKWERYLDEPIVPLDPWGQEYFYRHPSSGDRDFDLFSKGADGQEGTDDDIPKPIQ